MAFIAEFPGDCDACGQQIKGQEVTYTANDELVHVHCPEDPTTLNRPVCPVHFTELSVTGKCGECE